MTNIDEMSINAIRVLSADAIQKANSGHPGLPLGTAPTAYELWTNHMNYNPADPEWENRDRFVLSGGHGSMLLYSLFHLLGIGNLSLDDVKNFRQMGSKTPGHPEYGHTVGVEATTGPLGQGIAMAVGMTMAEAHLASVFNKEGYNVVDHYTYVLGGDGCMMEGISSECFSLAGTLGLSKLIVFYDSNNISIEGSTDIAFTENVMKRFEAFGFQTIEVAARLLKKPRLIRKDLHLSRLIHLSDTAVLQSRVRQAHTVSLLVLIMLQHLRKILTGHARVILKYHRKYMTIIKR